MVTATQKIRLKFLEFIFLTWILIFPFGQLLRIEIAQPFPFTLHPIDIPPLISLILLSAGVLKKPGFFKYLSDFFLAALFSYIFSVFIFKSISLPGFFYLIRLAAYGAFMVLTWNVVVEDKRFRKTENDVKNVLINALLILSMLTGILGWLQYLLLPDLRSLQYLGWDDHLYRLAGMFLDPGFTGIIIVLGLVITTAQYLYTKKRIYILPALFLLSALALTYSRASYLSFLAGMIGLVIKNIKGGKKLVVIIVMAFILSLPFLPRPGGYGVMLERTHSISARIANYGETLRIFKESPIFGIGYNNMCEARSLYLKDQNAGSHACTGSDSSLLFVLATTGIIGFIIFIKLLIEIIRCSQNDIYGVILTGSLWALIVHSFFVNSLFYAWIMGWMVILTALNLKKED